jgi:hypothetical protein
MTAMVYTALFAVAVQVLRRIDVVAMARSIGAAISTAVEEARRRNSASAIIGESAGRVRWAKANRYHLAEIFDMAWLGFDEVMEFNRAWIRSVMTRRMIVIDVGLDPDRGPADRGVFYQMELIETSAYPLKIIDPTVPGSIVTGR